MLTGSKRRGQETGESLCVGTLLYAIKSMYIHTYIYNTAFVSTHNSRPTRIVRHQSQWYLPAEFP